MFIFCWAPENIFVNSIILLVAVCWTPRKVKKKLIHKRGMMHCLYSLLLCHVSKMFSALCRLTSQLVRVEHGVRVGANEGDGHHFGHACERNTSRSLPPSRIRWPEIYLLWLARRALLGYVKRGVEPDNQGRNSEKVDRGTT